MNAALLFHLDEKWERCENGALRPLPKYPALEEPALVLTDFGKSVSGVFTASDNAHYLEAVIARRLRDDGLIDGEVRVLIHAVARGAGSHQVFYTAVPVENWQRLQSWAQSRREHCLLIAYAGLMPCLLSGDNTAVVFHCNREISLLARQQRILGYCSVMAMSTREADFLEAVSALLRRLPAGADGADGAKLKLQWHTFGDPLSPELKTALQARLSQSGLVNARYASLPQTPGSASSQAADALTILSRPLQAARLAANPWSAKFAWFAESQLPRLGACMALCTVLLFAWACVALYQAHSFGQEVERSRAVMRQTAEQTAPPEAHGQDFAITRDLIDAIAQAQAAIDPYAFLVNLRAAATAYGVHILRVSMKGEAITLEGWIEQKGGRDDALAAFLIALRRQDFMLEAVPSSAPTAVSGFFAYRLTPGASHKGGSR
ncbi:MAG: hypothetical protein LBO00_00595 [Zoogloeaceae bacterium]|jgi:hypothetical protein|nr:hypothetical protein [Zoogloeaceae bacterium]